MFWTERSSFVGSATPLTDELQLCPCGGVALASSHKIGFLLIFVKPIDMVIF